MTIFEIVVLWLVWCGIGMGNLALFLYTLGDRNSTLNQTLYTLLGGPIATVLILMNMVETRMNWAGNVNE